MASTLEMTFTFDPSVSYNGTTVAIAPVTSTKTFGSEHEVLRFLEAYRIFKNVATTASADTVVTAWWDSVTDDIIRNVGTVSPCITLT